VRERVSGVVRAREGGRARLREVESVASWKAVFEARAEFSSIRDKKEARPQWRTQISLVCQLDDQ